MKNLQGCHNFALCRLKPAGLPPSARRRKIRAKSSTMTFQKRHPKGVAQICVPKNHQPLKSRGFRYFISSDKAADFGISTLLMSMTPHQITQLLVVKQLHYLLCSEGCLCLRYNRRDHFSLVQSWKKTYACRIILGAPIL